MYVFKKTGTTLRGSVVSLSSTLFFPIRRRKLKKKKKKTLSGEGPDHPHASAGRPFDHGLTAVCDDLKSNQGYTFFCFFVPSRCKSKIIRAPGDVSWMSPDDKRAFGVFSFSVLAKKKLLSKKDCRLKECARRAVDVFLQSFFCRVRTQVPVHTPCICVCGRPGGGPAQA